MWPRMRDDYEPGSANPGQSLVKSSSQDAWEPGAEPGGGGGGGGASALADLTDVDLTGAVTGYVLTVDGSGIWKPAPGGGGGGGAVSSVNGQTGAVVLGASDVGAATAAQGAKADTAVQPGDLADVATSGAYGDLSGRPSIPSTPGDIGAATAAQGSLADTAVQPGDDAAVLGSGAATSGQVLTADGSGGTAWQAGGGGGGGAPVVATPGVGRWFTYPFFTQAATSEFIRANRDMPLLVAEAMSIDAVTVQLTTVPSEGTTATIDLHDAAGTKITTLGVLPVPTTTGELTMTFDPVHLAAGVYLVHFPDAAYNDPNNKGAKFGCARLIGWDAGVGLAAPEYDSNRFPRRMNALTHTPVSPVVYVRRSA